MKVGEWDVSLRSLISIRWKNHLPHLVLHEKFEKHAKWTARVITAVAILSSVIAFPVWYLSLAFAVFMFLIEQFVERFIFEYTSIYVQPMPDFALKTEEWKGMAFALPQEPDPNLLNVVGCAFATRITATSSSTFLGTGTTTRRRIEITTSVSHSSSKMRPTILHISIRTRIVKQ